MKRQPRVRSRRSAESHEPGSRPAGAAPAAVLDLPEPAASPVSAAAGRPEPDPAPDPHSTAPPAARDPEPQLVVAVAQVLYAVPIMGIEEILPMREVAPLPRSATAVRGILFLRGHPVTVIDLGMQLGGPPTRGARIVVLALGGERYGLVVDQVLKVVVPGDLRDPAPPPAALLAAPAVRAVARLGEEVITLLDLERLIPAPPAVRTGS